MRTETTTHTCDECNSQGFHSDIGLSPIKGLTVCVCCASHFIHRCTVVTKPRFYSSPRVSR
ncbi:hypothetical protein J6590_084030 [Homalodisca vitripennis]|nr:hypothetical protein J6590_084030 [Homalodisca vitripennis]